MHDIRNARATAFLMSILLCVSLSVLLFASCKDRQTGDAVRIGVVLSLTGDVGAYGQRSLKGLQVAEKEINGSGGIAGRKLQLIIEDAKSSPKDGVSAFQKLVDVEKLHIVVGDVLSGTTLAMAPIAERNKVLLFAPGASNPSLRDAGDYIFRNWVSDDFDGKAVAHYMFETGIQRAFLLNQQTDYCVGLADAFQKEFTHLGGKVGGREGLVTDAADFRAQLVKLQASGANVAYVVAEARQTGTILRQAQEMGIKMRWFATLTVDTPECRTVAGPARESVVFTTPAFDPSSKEPSAEKFTKAFRQQFKEDPDVTSAIAYDALMILAHVMKTAGTEPESVKNALYKVKDFPGASGRTTFDDHGDVVKGIFVKEIKNDQPILLKTFAF